MAGVRKKMVAAVYTVTMDAGEFEKFDRRAVRLGMQQVAFYGIKRWSTEPKAKPVAKPELCLTLTVSPKMITADGRPDRVTVKVTAGKQRVRGTKVVISGSGVRKTGRSNGNGVAVLRINPQKAGLVTITAVETNQRVCGPKRIGVVGVFLPPLTG